ncbi:NAD(P)-binding protein [Mytilinidion resinicola]|uniref:NAD(P)-binding protein n=1 Tax=Mytilinidion resinicola TaxID=574789 RepID=A0A6A6Y0V7_9PEZI|nr:NAD(P)-binding protein [Mytilinidion resinicola]KAF2801865.1 NAD(P)-binding protein [Mytilinidion resinicola]
MSDSTIVLITGGNTGIGYETVKALYASSKGPYTILLGGRSIEKVNNAIAALQKEIPDTASKLVPLQVDIESDESITAAFETVKSSVGYIDVLINNAGGQFDTDKTDESPASIRTAMNRAYNLNVTSTQVITMVFEPLLLKSKAPRLLFVTSGLSSLTTATAGKNPPPGLKYPWGYLCSKTALNMQMRGWCNRLEEHGAKTWCISPGLLATGLTGAGPEAMKKMGAQGPEIGGVFIKDVVEGARDDRVGLVVDRAGVQPW